MASSLTPEQRRTLGALGAAISWANTADPKSRTAPARRAFEARFEKQVDPDGVLDPAERARRAGQALKAHMLRLAYASSRARSKAAQARRDAEALDAQAEEASAELAELDGSPAA